MMNEIVTSHSAVRLLNGIERALMTAQSRRSDKVGAFLDVLHQSGFTVVEDAAAVNAPTMTAAQADLPGTDEGGAL